MRQDMDEIRFCWSQLDGMAMLSYIGDACDIRRMRGSLGQMRNYVDVLPDTRGSNIAFPTGAQQHQRLSRLLRRLNAPGCQHARDVFMQQVLELVSALASLRVMELAKMSIHGWTLGEMVGTWPMSKIASLAGFIAEAMDFVDWAFEGPAKLGLSELACDEDRALSMPPHYSLSALCVLSHLLAHSSIPPLPTEYMSNLEELGRAQMKLQQLVILFCAQHSR